MENSRNVNQGRKIKSSEESHYISIIIDEQVEVRNPLI
jgi:hypothetical protein